MRNVNSTIFYKLKQICLWYFNILMKVFTLYIYYYIYYLYFSKYISKEDEYARKNSCVLINYVYRYNKAIISIIIGKY